MVRGLIRFTTRASTPLDFLGAPPLPFVAVVCSTSGESAESFGAS